LKDRSRSTGRVCGFCKRSQYEHEGGRPNRGCNVRLISERTMKDQISGAVLPFEIYVPDSPFPRTKEDPRRWVHANSLGAANV
jgi:hypothetical protein